MEMGVSILTAIGDIAKTPCGYASVKNVENHVLDNRMESFFLAETTKYLYLLFSPDHWIHGSDGVLVKSTAGECILDTGGYIFNTEAHPIDTAAVYCCSSRKQKADDILQQFRNRLDLSAILGFTDRGNDHLQPLDEILSTAFNNTWGANLWHLPKYVSKATKRSPKEKIDKIQLGVLRNLSNAKDDSFNGVCDAAEVHLFNYYKANSMKFKQSLSLSCPSPSFLDILSVAGESFEMNLLID